MPGRRRQRPQREVRSRYMVPNANVEHAAAAAEDEAGFGEELDVEPSTTSGGRPPQQMLHVVEEAVPGGPAGGTTTTTTDDGGGDDDDDDGGETASSGSSKPYQCGPSSLPEPRPLPSRRPMIRPVGQT